MRVVVVVVEYMSKCVCVRVCVPDICKCAVFPKKKKKNANCFRSRKPDRFFFFMPNQTFISLFGAFFFFFREVDFLAGYEKSRGGASIRTKKRGKNGRCKTSKKKKKPSRIIFCTSGHRIIIFLHR